MIVSYDEWLRMPEVSDATEEVVNGEIRITPPAKWTHARTVARVRDQLILQFDDRKFHVVTAQFGLIIRKAPLTCQSKVVWSKYPANGFRNGLW